MHGDFATKWKTKGKLLCKHIACLPIAIILEPLDLLCSDFLHEIFIHIELEPLALEIDPKGLNVVKLIGYGFLVSISQIFIFGIKR